MNYIPETEHQNEVILNHNVKDDMVCIYNPDGSLLGVTDNQLTFNDFRIQVKTKKLEGYSISLGFPNGNGEKIKVDSDGHLERWPAGLFNTLEEQLDILLGL